MKSLFMSFSDKGLHKNDEGGSRAHEGGVFCVFLFG